jgi:integrase
MPTLRLTDKSVTAARAKKGERLELWDEQTPGLCLRVSDSGKKVWVYRYRTLDGRQPRLTLGDYSIKHGLKWAREEVEELRVQVRKGHDPAGARKRAKREALSQPLRTFNDLADAYVAACEKGHWKPRKKQKRTSTIEGERGVLRRNVRPVIGEDRLEDIDRAAIKKLLNDMLDRGIGAQTNKTHAVIRQVFAYAIGGPERLTVNPAASIEKPATETPRSRVLTDAEMKTLWTTLVRYPNELRLPAKTGEAEGRRLSVGRPMRIALQLAALLLVRRSEVAGMRTVELDLAQGLWLIPGERMKSGKAHLVPLPTRAVDLIKEALILAKAGAKEPPEHVFLSPRGDDRPFRPDSVTHAMVGLCAALRIAPAAPHDLRRTASTALTSERLGVSPFIRSKILAHGNDAGGGAAVSSTHYDANAYVTEKRRALEAWEGLLLEIVGERQRPSNLRSLRGGGA